MTAAVWLYGFGLTAHAIPPRDLHIEIQGRAIATHDGRDQDGRLWPLLIHVEGENWLAPVPAYATAVAVTLWPDSTAPGRWVAVFMGALDVVLIYLIAAHLFGAEFLACTAAAMLLVTPAHFHYSRLAGQEGIWPLAFVLGWLLGLIVFLESASTLRRGRLALALAMVSLTGSVYTQPSAVDMFPLFFGLTLVTLFRAEHARRADRLAACGVAAAALIPLLLWFAIYPKTYLDTYGRWFLHPAYLRNPVAWARAVTHWHTLTVWSDVFWDFFAPATLFFDVGMRGHCGVFLFATSILIVLGLVAMLREPEAATVRRVNGIILSGFIVGPFVAATFMEFRAVQRSLVIVPFGVLLASFGVDALWRRQTVGGKALTVLLLIWMIGQFLYCYQALL